MADSPKEAEAAQALFCAVVDYEGKKIHPKPRNYRAFARTYEGWGRVGLCSRSEYSFWFGRSPRRSGYLYGGSEGPRAYCAE